MSSKEIVEVKMDKEVFEDFKKHRGEKGEDVDDIIEKVIRKNISNAKNLEKGESKQNDYKKGSNGTYSESNKLNELTGKEWLYFTKTILRTSYPSELGHELRREHQANKPPRLMKEIIEFFTKSDQEVLDPFAGVGGTLLGASLSSRRATGIEINKKWIDIYKQVCQEEDLEEFPIVHGDSLVEMRRMIEDDRKFDAIITDPPYSPALEKTLCDEKYDQANRKSNLTTFSDEDKDFRNAESFEEYYDLMEETGELMYELIKDERYIAVMIRDSYQDSKYIHATAEVSKRLEKAGFVPKGIKIWYQTGSPVRPYGYPYAYVPNIVHHNIIIMRKEE